jgi:hypothetical protein
VAYGGAIFYSDLSSFNGAMSAAGLPKNVIDFESVPTGDYSTAAGLTVSGLNFVGPFSQNFLLRVFPESGWGENFAIGTGNTLSGVGLIDITLPPGTRAFGANVGNSFVWATGESAGVGFQLSTGEFAYTPTSTSRLFPFFGFVSDVPVNSLEVSGASFLTIDNVTFGPTTVPEPSALLLSSAGFLLLRAIRRRAA